MILGWLWKMIVGITHNCNFEFSSTQSLAWVFSAIVLWSMLDVFECPVLETPDILDLVTPLAGGFKHLDYFPIDWEFHHTNWLSLHDFSEG